MSKKKKILGLALGGSLLFGAPMGASAALSASVPHYSTYGVTGIQGFGSFDAGSLNKSRSNHQAAKELKANIVAAVKAKAEAAAKEEASVVVPEVAPEKEPAVAPEKGEEEKVPAEEATEKESSEDDWSVDENTEGSIEQQYHWELNEDGVWMELDSYGNWTGKTSDTDPTAKSETSTEESAVEQQGCLITIDGITYLTNYDENGNLTSVKRASSGYEYNFDELDDDVLDKLREETKSFYDANNSGTASEEETPKKDKVSTEQMPTSYSYDLNTFEVVGYDENGNELVRNPMSSVEKDLGGRTCTVYLDMDGNPVIVYEHQEGMTVSWDDLTDELKNEYYTGSQTTEDTSAPAEGEAMVERVIIDVSAQQASIGEDFSAIANKQNELEALASEIQNKQNELNSCDDPDQRTVLENELEEMLVQSADIESEIAYYEHEIEVLREEIANEAAKGQQLESEGYEVDYVGFDWETQK